VVRRGAVAMLPTRFVDFHAMRAGENEPRGFGSNGLGPHGLGGNKSTDGGTR
jgi:hypothetical protein